MEEPVDSQLSMMSLEEELTCSICLSPFSCPVTIPCGHNFCQDCILETWTDSYSCPQCRTVFPSKPELRKNTVLSNVVETFNQRASRAEGNLQAAELEPQEKDVIRCDTCMETEASRTCLTCMASFCEEHLRPHRENPNFSLHQLSEPIGDLLERICSDHHKLMEFFCSQHGRPICSLCLQQVHKGCPFVSPEEQRSMRESDLSDKLSLLNGKIERTETVLNQMDDMQLKLKDAASKRKTALAALYQQMRDLLAQEEKEAQLEVEHELMACQDKLGNFTKRLTMNMKTLERAKEDINSQLSQSQTMSFLQTMFDLPGVVKFDPYTPRINLDSAKVKARQTFADELKNLLTQTFKEPLDDRLVKLKTGETAAHPVKSADTQPKAVPVSPPTNVPPTPPPPPPIAHFVQSVPVYVSPPVWNPAWHRPGQHAGPFRTHHFNPQKKTYQKDSQASGGTKKSEKASESGKKSHPESKSEKKFESGKKKSEKASESGKKSHP